MNQLKPSEYTTNQEPEYLSTRYQGSKSKIIGWIWQHISHLNFDTCLDAFGGTGSVASLFKRKRKQVTYNDNLRFNYTIGKAIIENNQTVLSEQDIESILRRNPSITYPKFVQQTYNDIFFLKEENRWLDMAITNIHRIEDEYKKAIAFTALFQACIIKRPYNLFHRANLYMRTAEVERKFGNKTTWDKPFPHYFRQFAEEVNGIIFDNQRENTALCRDIFDVEPIYDLIYIDTPYMNNNGTGVDYLDFYHFLEGMLDYQAWPNRINHNYKHKRLIGHKSLWCQKKKIHEAFKKLFHHFRNCTLVVSYRSKGIPTKHELIEMINKYKDVDVVQIDYQYALSKTNGSEILLIGT